MIVQKSLNGYFPLRISKAALYVKKLSIGNTPTKPK